MNVNQSDFELLSQIRTGDTQAEELLITRYAKNVRATARVFSLSGWDLEDFIQEGMLALIRALHSYDEGGGASLSSYIDLCVRRQLLNAVLRATNNKNILLTDYISYDAPVTCGEDTVSLSDTLTDERASALEEDYITRDRADRLLKALNDRLSPLERRVLTRYLQGDSLSEIAEALQLPAKSVDNAITRVRRKATALTKLGDIR